MLWPVAKTGLRKEGDMKSKLTSARSVVMRDASRRLEGEMPRDLKAATAN